MLNASQLEEMAKKIADVVPQGVGGIPSGVQDQVKVVLARTLEKMDLVSREEFDIQVAVLAKTRQKLEALEKMVADLEQ
ncbi:MAG: accessory factor UbiK family protein [Thiomicrorhabdus sp.]|nr:accessory factor UbiK family protein [Thiomicrorhabdus sp.]MCF6299145.1 accessory factor UbiK family protein [Thiomicrorhabdus sp.]